MGPADDIESDGIHGINTRGNRGKHEINVVNHHIEHGPDIGAPERVAARANGFEQGPFSANDLVGHRDGRFPCRIEPFDVTDLENTEIFPGSRNKFHGFTAGNGDRFFHQDVQAAMEALHTDGVVRDRRRRDDDGVDFRDHRLDVLKSLDAMFVRGGFPGGYDRIEYADQLHLGMGGRFVRMKGAEATAADNSEFEHG